MAPTWRLGVLAAAAKPRSQGSAADRSGSVGLGWVTGQGVFGFLVLLLQLVFSFIAGLFHFIPYCMLLPVSWHGELAYS